MSASRPFLSDIRTADSRRETACLPRIHRPRCEDAMRYDRTVIAYHGCDEAIARRLLEGDAFNND
jgi:hypothetical protein